MRTIHGSQLEIFLKRGHHPMYGLSIQSTPVHTLKKILELARGSRPQNVLLHPKEIPNVLFYKNYRNIFRFFINKYIDIQIGPYSTSGWNGILTYFSTCLFILWKVKSSTTCGTCGSSFTCLTVSYSSTYWNERVHYTYKYKRSLRILHKEP